MWISVSANVWVPGLRLSERLPQQLTCMTLFEVLLLGFVDEQLVIGNTSLQANLK